MKLEIINSSMGFVADFWNFAEEKSSELNIPEIITDFFAARANSNDCAAIADSLPEA
jgi:hypothetical protein